MSLVIAKKIENDIFLISDTKLTKIDNITSNTQIDDNVLKLVIISPQLVFGFAGGERDAEATLKRISLIRNVEEIKSILLDDHLNSLQLDNYKVEFLLATGKPNFELIQFKNGKQSSEQNIWLGSKDAFNLFQGYKLGKIKPITMPKTNPENPKLNFPSISVTMDFNIERIPTNENKTNQIFTDNYSTAKSAIKNVIESDTISEVGGFYLPIAFVKDEFIYMTYTDIFSAEQILPITNGPNVISFGNPQGGSYNISLMPIKDKNKLSNVSFHFSQGEFGIVYERKDNGLPRPVLFSKHDAVDFSFALQKRFSLNAPPGFSIGYELDNFGLNAEKYIKKGEYDIALERLNFAIKKFSNKNDVWKFYNSRSNLLLIMKKFEEALYDYNKLVSMAPKDNLELIYYNRGIVFFNLIKFKPAIENFNEALRINPKNYLVYYNRSLSYYNLARIERSKIYLANSKEDLENAVKYGYNIQHLIISLKSSIEQLNAKL